MQCNISPHLQEGDLSYVNTVKGLLRPVPPCKNCQSKYKLHYNFYKKKLSNNYSYPYPKNIVIFYLGIHS